MKPANLNEKTKKAIIALRPLHWEYNREDMIYYLIDSDSDEILETKVTESRALETHKTIVKYRANIAEKAFFIDLKLTDRMPF